MANRRLKTQAARPMPLPTPEDLDRSMWNMFSEIRGRTPVFHAPGGRAPKILTGGPLPPNREPPRPQMQLNGRLPQYDTPSYFSRTFEFSGKVCCTFFRRRTVVWNYTVPADYMLIIDGLSFTQVGMQPGEVVQCTIQRSGTEMISVEDMYMGALGPEPSGTWAFSSQIDPMPLWLMIDHDQTITVSVELMGLYPFVAGPVDPWCGDLRVYLTGWLANIRDNRDGAPRPIDQGSFNDIAQNGASAVTLGDANYNARLGRLVESIYGNPSGG